MIEDEILLNFLNNAVNKAKKQIEEEGRLTVENAIPLLLQSQFNHILHLDSEISALRKLIDERFGKVEEKFEQINKRIGWLFGIVIAIMGIGFTYLSILISVVK